MPGLLPGEAVESWFVLPGAYAESTVKPSGSGTLQKAREMALCLGALPAITEDLADDHNYLNLQLQGVWCSLLESKGIILPCTEDTHTRAHTHTHAHICTQN